MVLLIFCLSDHLERLFQVFLGLDRQDTFAVPHLRFAK